MNEYEEWINLKKVLEEKEINFHFREKEIWWCHLGLNVGQEENGKHQNFERPVLILKKINKNLFIGIPLTTKYKNEYYKFPIGEIKGETNYVLWQQIRILSSKRLQEKIIDLSSNFFEQIIKIVSLLF